MTVTRATRPSSTSTWTGTTYWKTTRRIGGGLNCTMRTLLRFGGEVRSGRSRPASHSFGGDEVTFVVLAIGRRFRVIVGAEEVRQLGPVGFSAAVHFRCRIAVDASKPKRLRQPTAIGQETLGFLGHVALRSEEHTSELQSPMRIPHAVFCLKKKNNM